jgi:hypothetical protein
MVEMADNSRPRADIASGTPFKRALRLLDELTGLFLDRRQLPLLRKIESRLKNDTSEYHNSRSDLISRIEALMSIEMKTPDRQKLISEMCPPKLQDRVAWIDAEFMKLTPQDRRKLIAKMCPPNV